jgi:hypothetical protein
VKQIKWQNEIYVLVSGNGGNLDIFKIKDLPNSGFVGREIING